MSTYQGAAKDLLTWYGSYAESITDFSWAWV